LWVLGLTHGSLPCVDSLGVDSPEGVVGEEKLASGVVREDISSSVSKRAWVVAEIADSSPISQPRL
jgi:hypothetical protein